MNWIDVNEKLPTLKDGRSRTLLGATSDGCIYIGNIEMELSDKGIVYVFYEDRECTEKNITHWAEITPPPTK